MDRSSCWTCHVCTLENPSRRKRCTVCETRRAVTMPTSCTMPSSAVVSEWIQKRKRKRTSSGTLVHIVMEEASEQWKPLFATGWSAPNTIHNSEDQETSMTTKLEQELQTFETRVQNPDADNSQTLCLDDANAALVAALPLQPCNDCKPGLPEVPQYTECAGMKECESREVVLPLDCTAAKEPSDAKFSGSSSTRDNASDKVSFHNETRYNLPVSDGVDGTSLVPCPSHDHVDSLENQGHMPLDSCGDESSSTCITQPLHAISTGPCKGMLLGSVSKERRVPQSKSQGHRSPEDNVASHEVRFSQLMTQQQCGFLYTPASQEQQYEENVSPSLSLSDQIAIHSNSPKRMEMVENYGSGIASNDRECDESDPMQSALTDSYPPTACATSAKESLILKRIERQFSRNQRSNLIAAVLGLGSHTANIGSKLAKSDESNSSIAKKVRLIPSAGGLPEPNNRVFTAPFASSSSAFRAVGPGSDGTLVVNNTIEASTVIVNELVQSALCALPKANSPPPGISSTEVAAFQTAGRGLTIDVSEESMAEATRLLYADEIQKEETHQNVPLASLCTLPSKVVAFKTAGRGMNIAVSEESLAKAKELLMDEREPTATSQLASVPALALGVAAYETAGPGLNIQLLEDATNKIKNRVDTSHGISNASVDASPSGVVAFQTAGRGVTICVSDESMGKAAMLLAADETRQESHPRIPHASGSASSSEVVAFKTAGRGLNITVTNESIAKATELLANERNPVETSDASVFTLSLGMAAFQTTGAQLLERRTTEITKRKEAYHNVPDASVTASNPGIVAFQTAGRGLTIDVSEESMTKAAMLLATDETATESLSRIPHASGSVSPSGVVAFKTAGQGMNITASEESIARAREHFTSENKPLETSRASVSTLSSGIATYQMMGIQRSEDSIADVTRSASPLGVVAFQTAGRRLTIKVSEESIDKATKLLAVAETANESLSNIPHGSGFASPSGVVAFKTAGRGMNITVSEESIAKAKECLANEGTSLETLYASVSTLSSGMAMYQTTGIQLSEDSKADATRSAPPSEVVAFQTTGRGLMIKVSEESMKKANKLLAADETMSESHSSIPLASGSASSSGIVAFETAGRGLNVTVSEESLLNATEHLLAENPRKETHRSVSNTFVPASPLGVVSFQTAGESLKIKPSDEGIAEATRVLASEESGPASPLGVMFQTAGQGMKINVSEESMANAVKLLANDQNSGEALHAPSGILAFQTAGLGSTISVSEESMTKAMRLMVGGNIQKAALHSVPNAFASGLVEFGTAGRSSKTHLSDEGAAKASGAAEETPNETYQGISHACTGSVSFQTAGRGFNITVSEEDLVKATNLLGNERRSVEVSLADNSTDESKVTNSKGSDSLSQGNGCHLMSSIGMLNTTILSAALEVATDTSPRMEPEHNHSQSDWNGPFEEHINEDLREGPVTAILPQTPVVEHTQGRRGMLQSVDCVAIRSIAHGFTPQSQMTQAVEQRKIPELQSQAVEMHDEGVAYENGRAVSLVVRGCEADYTRPPSENAEFAILRKSSFEGDRFPSVTLGPSLPPSSTPQHNRGPSKSTLVTLPTDLKNPYLRKRLINATDSPIETPRKRTNKEHEYSPIPFKFHHMEGKFRGKIVSPSLLLHAESVFAPGSAQRNIRLMVGDTCARNDEDAGTEHRRLSLSRCASLFGQMSGKIEDCLRLGVSPITIAVNSTNATKVRFDADSGLPCSFMGQISPAKSIGSVDDIRKALVARGCDAAIGIQWIHNHTRWIIWKLASMERSFPSGLAGRYCTYSQLLSQLQKRHDKELKDGKRSALRKVLNRDVTSNSMMILCVSHIFHEINNERKGPMVDSTCSQTNSEVRIAPVECKLELTDGWYSIQGALDFKLNEFVRNGTISVGCKLLICSAAMKGPEGGIDPLDETYTPTRRNCTVGLVLSVNATRLAKWDAKLGFVNPSQTLRVNRGILLVRKIADIIPGGGNIPLIDLIVCRAYPRMFLERQSVAIIGDSTKRIDGTSVAITETEEYSKRIEYEKRRQKLIERLSEAIQTECAKEIDEMAPALWQGLMKSNSPCDFYERLPRPDQLIVDKWKERRDVLMQSMVQKEIESRLDEDETVYRESTPFVRVFVKSYDPIGSDKRRVSENAYNGALLTVWNVSDDQMSLLKEGNVVRVQNLAVRASTYDGMLQLTAGPRTFMEVTPSPPSLLQLSSLGYTKRTLLNVFRLHIMSKKVSNITLPSSPLPEVDTVGIILRVVEYGSGATTRQLIYLTDESGLLLRVEREGPAPDSNNLTSTSNHAIENVKHPTIIAFQDIRVTLYDGIENCAVAVYAQTSSVLSKGNPQRVSVLRKWSKSPSGYCLLSRVAACVDAEVPMVHRPATSIISAIGYLAGFDIPSTVHGYDPSHLLIKVDCGSEELQVWEFPLFLIDATLRLCGDSSTFVSLGVKDEDKYANLKVLGRVFGSRGLLLHFSLQLMTLSSSNYASCVYQVRQVKVADQQALAAVYIATAKHNSQLLKSPSRKQ